MTGRNRSARARLGLSTENVTGVNIRAIRNKKLGHLSDREYCQHLLDSTGLQLSKSALSRIETGKRGVMDFELERIAKSLGVDVSELFKSQI